MIKRLARRAGRPAPPGLCCGCGRIAALLHAGQGRRQTARPRSRRLWIALPLPPGRPLPATPLGRTEVPDCDARAALARSRPWPGGCASPICSMRRPGSARSGSRRPTCQAAVRLPPRPVPEPDAGDRRPNCPPSYTIASSPTRSGYCELTVKREDRGLSSRHLHDGVRIGDLLDVQAPAGPLHLHRRRGRRHRPDRRGRGGSRR